MDEEEFENGKLLRIGLKIVNKNKGIIELSQYDFDKKGKKTLFGEILIESRTLSQILNYLEKGIY